MSRYVTRHIIEDARLTLLVWLTSPRAHRLGWVATVFVGAYIGFSLPI